MIGQPLVAVASAAQSRVVQAGSAVIMVPVASTTLHAAGISGSLDPTALSTGLAEPGLWISLAAAAGFGGIGGVVAELISLRGHIELPHRGKPRKGCSRRSRLTDPRNEIDLGIFGRMLLGAAAAVALLSLNAPATAAALLVNSLIAGSAATAVFRLVQGRMLGKAQPVSAAEKPVQPHRTGLSVVGGAPAPTPAAVQ